MAAHLLLLGRAERRETISILDTYCPACRQVTKCKNKQVAEYWSVFFIPVKLMAVLTPYKKCTTCETRFPAYCPLWESLDIRTSLEFVILTCMIRVKMANGAAQRREDLTLMQRQFLAFTNSAVEETDILLRAAFLKKVTEDGAYSTQKNYKSGIYEDLLPVVVAPLETEQQKLGVLQSMAAVVAAKNKKVNPKEAKVFVQVGDILGLSQDQIRPFLPLGYKL